MIQRYDCKRQPGTLNSGCSTANRANPVIAVQCKQMKMVLGKAAVNGIVPRAIGGKRKGDSSGWRPPAILCLK